MTLLISNQSLQLFYNNNDTCNSNNTNNNVYGAVIMAETLQEFTQIEQQVAGNLQIKPTDLAREPIGYRLLLSTVVIYYYPAQG